MLHMYVTARIVSFLSYFFQQSIKVLSTYSVDRLSYYLPLLWQKCPSSD
jgi:hypothetical protein